MTLGSGDVKLYETAPSICLERLMFTGNNQIDLVSTMQMTNDLRYFQF